MSDMTETEITAHYDGLVECMFDPAEHVYSVREWIEHSGGAQWSAWSKVNGVTSSLLSEKPWLSAWAVKVGAEAATAEFSAIPSTDLMKDKKGRMIQVRNVSDLAWDSLVKTFKGAHRKKKDDAADIGTQAHKWCEDWSRNNGIAPPIINEVRACTDQFLRWVADQKAKIKYAEVRVVSLEHDYAGTVDLIAEVDGELMLADIKTSNQISKDYWLQTAAYAKAWREERGYNLRRGILRLPKDGAPYEWVTRSTGDDDRDETAFINSLRLARWHAIEGAR